MKRNTMREVLTCLIDTVRANLDEIAPNARGSEFICGETYAYLECLEIIQTWTEADRYELRGNLEEKYLTE